MKMRQDLTFPPKEYEGVVACCMFHNHIIDSILFIAGAAARTLKFCPFAFALCSTRALAQQEQSVTTRAITLETGLFIFVLL